MDIKGKIKENMADFCKNTCPACVAARKKQKGLAYNFVVRFEDRCPACKAYTEVYGKLPHEPLD